MRKPLIIALLACLAVAEVGRPVETARSVGSPPVLPSFAVTYFVRTDGSTSTNCTGLADAAYDGSGTGEACAFQTVVIALTVAVCGDTIKVKENQTFDAASPIVITHNCTAGTKLLITTTGALTASTRVSPANAALMPRFRATGGETIFRTVSASHIHLDGLSLTDNMAGGSQRQTSLIDFASTASNLTVTRCLGYPKEAITDPTNFNRPLIYGIQADGDGLVFEWNYIYGLGLRNGLGQSEAKAPISVLSGKNLTVRNNFLEGGYIASMFTGGGGEPPENTATLSSASSTSATFSSVANLQNGLFVRFDLGGTGTLTGSPSFPYVDDGNNFNFQTLTRTGGTALVNFDGAGTRQGFHIRFVDVGGGPEYRGRLKKVDGNAYTVVWEYGANAPAGTYNWVVWEVAKVTNVAGNVVTYTGIGPNGLLQAPQTPGQAAWRLNQVVHDISITKNTINIDPVQAIAEWNATNNSPKGWFEFKSGDTILIDGNHFTNYPSVIGVTQHSNEGGTPWTQVKNLTITNNFFDAILDSAHFGSRQALVIALTDPYNSNEPGKNFVFSNNLAKNVIHMGDFNGDLDISTTVVSHNTFVNDHQSAVYGSKLIEAIDITHGFTFTDNIAAFNSNGIHCNVFPFTIAACFPSGVFNHNVIVDNLGASVNVNSFGTASILSPIKTAFSQVGFVNTSINDYRLSAGSVFKGAGNGGTDPGVNWTALVTALGFDPSGGPAPSPSPTPPQPGSICRWNSTPPCQVP